MRLALILVAVSELLLLLGYVAQDGVPAFPVLPDAWNYMASALPGPWLLLVQLAPAFAAVGLLAFELLRRWTRLRRPAGEPVDSGTPRGAGTARRTVLLREMRPYGPSIVTLALISLAAVPLALVAPWPLKIIVDNVVGTQRLPGFLAFFASNPAAPSADYALIVAIAILLGAAALTSLQNLANIWLTNKLGNRMTVDMRVRLFRQLQRLSILYHDTKGTGDSTYRIQYDAMWLQSMTTDGLVPVVTDLLTVAGYLVVILVFDWQLAVIGLLVTPVMFLLTLVYRRRMKLGWKRIKRSESRAMSAAQESLSAARVVKAFGQEERESQEFYSRYAETAYATVRVMVQGGIYGLGLGLITAVGIAAVFLLGVRHVQAGIITIGELIVVSAYLTALYGPLKDTGKSVLNMQMAVAGMDRFLEVLGQGPDVPQKRHARALDRAKGRIAFRDVTFGYERDHPVLRHVSFTLSPGTRLGIVGPTGSGKTTLSSLLLRFFDPAEGSVTLDDTDLRDYKIADLRNQFAVVLQDTILFSMSIAENIRFGRPGATMDEVIAAAKAADAHDFITTLPDGYDTQVGERGMKLSGGERQRISIARAFLKDAPILILDEPTSALDVTTEQDILDSLRELMKGRTTLMIAHRPTTLRDCDAILILEQGEVASLTDDVDSVVRAMSPRSNPGGQTASLGRDAR